MNAPTAPEAISPRPTCAQCERPLRFCWCAHLVSLETRTHVVVLQHPVERWMPIGSARMASLCLPGSELHVGVDFAGSAAVARAISDPERPAVLLYPGPGAIDIDAHPPAGPVTLVVVDGTWHHARKIVRSNPAIAALPRYSFTPHAPTEYRLRREPDATYVSTLEALAHVLGVLEHDRERFRAMLHPFRAMIDAQIACERVEQNHRGRGPRAQRTKHDPRAILRDRAGDLVCVAAEANAWARRTDPTEIRPPDELLQWSAHRPATGETFEALIAPRHPLGPGTALQSGRSEEAIRAGEDRDHALARWRAFVRDGDVLCAWGTYSVALMENAGGFLPAARVDLRKIARDRTRGRAGRPAEFLVRAGGSADEIGAPLGEGRAALRLAEIVAVARALARGLA